MLSDDNLPTEPELPMAVEAAGAEPSAAASAPVELPLGETAPASPANPAAAEPTTLAEMVHLSQKGRMNPATEERAGEMLRDELLGGRAEIDAALEFIVVLPWPISVNALNAAWPQMKPYGRRLFVSGMKAGRFEGEMGRRIRLSLTRGLAKVDEPQAAKWACAIAHEMLGEEGTLAIRDRQSFFNVFIGKGKPWLLRLPLTGLKEGDVRAFLTCAVITVFSGGCPPYTQSSLLQWMVGSGKLDALEEKTLLIIAQTIRRWPGRLLRDYQEGAAALPPVLAEALERRTPGKGPESEPERGEPAAREPRPRRELEEIQPPVGETAEVEPSAESAGEADDDEPEEEEEDEEDDEEDSDGDADEDNEETAEEEEEDERRSEEHGRRPDRRDERPVRPPYISPGQASRPHPPGRTVPAPASQLAQNFDPATALRQLDQFVRQQAQQLQQTRTALRQREDELKRGGRSSGRMSRGGRRGDRYGSDAVWPETVPSEDAEALRRLVGQLEATNAELRVRLEDLAADGERKAESLTAPDGTPLDEREQLCHFLALKLAKDHADFKRLEKEPADEVFCEHYRLVLSSVFEILAGAGILPVPPPEG